MSRSKRFRNFCIAVWVGAAIAMVLFVSPVLFAGFLAKGDRFFAAVVPEFLILLANYDRTQSDAGALFVNPLLQQAAEAKAADMAAKGYFSHVSPDGTAPWAWIRETGYRFAAAGENLAVNFDDSTSLHNAWMLSPSHRRNLLNRRFTEIGIGMATGTYQGKGATFVVQMFARPL